MEHFKLLVAVCIRQFAGRLNNIPYDEMTPELFENFVRGFQLTRGMRSCITKEIFRILFKGQNVDRNATLVVNSWLRFPSRLTGVSLKII